MKCAILIKSAANYSEIETNEALKKEKLSLCSPFLLL